MEVIKPFEVSKDFDEMANKVFIEAIRLIGGLKKLVEYRNLTWLPSMALASYVVVLKNEGMYTNRQIAEKLGTTENTVENILGANEQEVMKFIKGEVEKVDEHKAGGLAKLAYKKLKEEGFERIELSHKHAEEIEKALELEFLWAAHVLMRIKGMEFPAEKGELEDRLRGLVVKGKDLGELVEELEHPITSPADLLKKLKQKLA